MTQKPNDGGPAFPTTLDYGECGSQTIGGMTLRDWFAGQALGAFIQRVTSDKIVAGMLEEGIQAETLLARYAYDMADAMIAVREAKP